MTDHGRFETSKELFFPHCKNVFNLTRKKQDIFIAFIHIIMQK